MQYAPTSNSNSSLRSIGPGILLGLVGLLVGIGAASWGGRALVPVFGVLVLAGIVARPEYGVALLMSTFLMAYPSWLQGSGYLTINNVLGGIFAVLLTYNVYRDQNFWFLRVPEIQIMLGLVVVYFIAQTLNAPDPLQISLLGAGFYFAEGLRIFVNRVAFTLFFINYIRTPGHVRMIYMLALAFMMITALTGVQSVLLGGGLKGYRAFTGTEELVAGQAGLIRAAGNPNRLAMFATMAAIGLWYLMQQSRSFWLRLLLVPTMVMLGLAVFLTASRSGLVGLLLAGLVILLDEGFDLRKIFAFAVGGLMLAVVALQFVPERNFERILNLPGTEAADSGEGAASLERRQYSWEVAFDLWQKNPAFGVGMGNWAVARFLNDPARSAGSPHNSYLLALVEGGPLAVIGFMMILWLSWRNLRIAEHYTGLPGFPLADLRWIVKSAKVSLIVFGFFTWVADLWNLVILFILVGFGIVVRRQVEIVLQRQAFAY